MNYIFFFRLIISPADKGTGPCLVGLAPDLRNTLMPQKFPGMTTWKNSGDYKFAEQVRGGAGWVKNSPLPSNASASPATMTCSPLSALYPV